MPASIRQFVRITAQSEKFYSGSWHTHTDLDLYTANVSDPAVPITIVSQTVDIVDGKIADPGWTATQVRIDAFNAPYLQ